MYPLLGKLLQVANKDDLVTAMPSLKIAVKELIISIRESETYEAASEYIHLLHLSTYPLAALHFKHHIDLADVPKDIFRF
mgnify:CR=1 FL=1